MKNKSEIFLGILLLILTSLSAQRSVICGNVTNTKVKTASFAYNQSVIGYKEIKQLVTIDAKGNFKFVFNSTQMYEIYLRIDEQYTSFCLQPGDSMTLKINYLDFDKSIVFSGKGADKNNFKKEFYAKFNLGHEQDIFQQTAKRNAQNFTAYCDSLLSEQISFTKNMMGDQNKFFTNHFIKTLRYKFAESKLDYPWMWAYLNRLKDTIPAMPYTYFNFLKELPLNNDTILSDYTFFSYLKAAMRHYENYVYQTSGKEWTHKENMNFAESVLSNEKILLAYESALVENAFGNEFVEAQKIYLDYEKKNPTSIYLPGLKEIYTKMESVSPGHKALVFILTDENGKKRGLDEFKGKLIYLDF